MRMSKYIYIYIYREREKGICGVMVTIIGNGHSDISSNAGPGCLNFT